MDSLTGWILAIFATLIGGVILLFIEYGIFQKRRQNEVPKEIDAESLLWKEAISAAVQDFSKNHTDSHVKPGDWTVINDKAQVHVQLVKKVSPPRLQGIRIQRTQLCTLTVDRKGDILEIKWQ